MNRTGGPKLASRRKRKPEVNKDISDNFGFINTRGPSIGVPSGLWMDFMDLCKKHVSAIFGFTGFKWSKQTECVSVFSMTNNSETLEKHCRICICLTFD